jgi:hypothetical protein
MGHANKGGHYKTDGGNARSTYVGCYAEQDGPPSFFGGISRVVGGLHGWEVKVNNEGKYYYVEDANKGYWPGGYIVGGFAKVDAH